MGSRVGWAKYPGEAICTWLLWRHFTWFYGLMCFLNSQSTSKWDAQVTCIGLRFIQWAKNSPSPVRSVQSLLELYTVGLHVGCIQLSSYNLIIRRYYSNETLAKRCFTVSPTSATLAQHWTNIGVMHNVWEKVLLPSKHNTFVWHLYNVGPTSSTLVQHCIKSYKCFVFTGCQ